ncbi:hypothetical protein BP5796_09429 [Coleophoma crateriformis]|uniref:Extracellular membrane protein CFEM domain-containing protein n=2 Tax=Coleophoma TaxID=453209 RepID=A0A3D8QKY4_9HELO|nr:hypothetical protein BP6252_11794 [Coleophoma cylindrospora]RDW66680.1 hypothetical protein BP5796_09429 [Coleophoma crateriformis]
MQFSTSTLVLLSAAVFSTSSLAAPTPADSALATRQTTAAASTDNASGSVACVSTFNDCLSAASGDAGAITSCSLALASCEVAANTKA